MARAAAFEERNYNIPRKIRELQLVPLFFYVFFNYNIPRKIRELQSMAALFLFTTHYNIPRKISKSFLSLLFKITDVWLFA